MISNTISAHGATIPALGLGTFKLLGKECAALVKSALEIGYKHIDTAAFYDNEDAVGAGLMASGVNRDDIFITTKVWYENLGDGAFQESAENSLRRLGLDDVDLLLVHWPKKGMSVEEMIGPLVDAKQRGLTRHIGVSNFPSEMLKQAFDVSGGQIVSNQCEYHPYLNQDKVLETCRSLGIAFTSYCPIARGEVFDEAIIKECAKTYHKTPAQIILRWQIQQEGVIAIPRTSSEERLSENAAIGDFELSQEEMQAISALKKPDTEARFCSYDFSPEWDVS